MNFKNSKTKNSHIKCEIPFTRMYLPHILENIRFLTLGLAGLRVITHSGSAVLQEISSLWGVLLCHVPHFHYYSPK